MNSTSTEGERIAKALSRRGVASRRDAERMILEGRVSVNGKVVTSPALNVTAADRLAVDGALVPEPEPTRLWLYHKPPGLVTTDQDEQGRATIYDGLPAEMPRVMSVGRLDLTSEGLLLLTNDGAIKRRLELPETGWLRRYRVRIKGAVSEAQLDRLRQGITVEGVDYQPMEVTFDRQQGANAWLTIALREGKNREIRRVMEALGVTVNRLIRISYGPFQLGKLAAGEVEEIPRRQVRDQLGLDGARPQPVRSRAAGAGKAGAGKAGEGRAGEGRVGEGRTRDGAGIASGRKPRAAGLRSAAATAAQDGPPRARAVGKGGKDAAQPRDRALERDRDDRDLERDRDDRGPAKAQRDTRPPRARPVQGDHAQREDRPAKPARWTKDRRAADAPAAGPDRAPRGRPAGKTHGKPAGPRSDGRGPHPSRSGDAPEAAGGRERPAGRKWAGKPPADKAPRPDRSPDQRPDRRPGDKPGAKFRARPAPGKGGEEAAGPNRKPHPAGPARPGRKPGTPPPGRKPGPPPRGRKPGTPPRGRKPKG